MIDLTQAKWEDHPANPMIQPPRPDWMAADPTVLTPDLSPDGKWHLFCNSVGYLRHYASDDGIVWDKLGGRICRGIRPFIYHEDGVYYLIYELHKPLWRSGIALRTSRDLIEWDEPQWLLRASQTRDGSTIRFLGNPCLVKVDKEYRLYFSNGWIWLWDCLYFEPKYVGLAVGSSPVGPFERRGEPLISPRAEHPYLNFGAGSIKVISDGEDGWWVFNNGIYKDGEGRSRSAIILLHTDDGVTFEQVVDKPIVAPEPGWKKAFVYAFDPVFYNDKWRLYYNARDGWLRGSERIGMAQAVLPKTQETK